jgi:hypothetical protein
MRLSPADAQADAVQNLILLRPDIQATDLQQLVSHIFSSLIKSLYSDSTAPDYTVRSLSDDCFAAGFKKTQPWAEYVSFRTADQPQKPAGC